MPVFAFFAAGVTVGGTVGSRRALTDPVALGIVAGLVVGKTVGMLGADLAGAAVHPGPARRGPRAGGTSSALALLGGIGFTVSLLIGELAFGAGTAQDEHVKVGVLLGSLFAAALAAVVLRVRNGHYRRLEAEEDDPR